MVPISLEKSKIRFLLLEGVHQSAVNVLHGAGYRNIEYLQTALLEDELIEKIKDTHFIGIRSRSLLTRRVFAAANKLVAVGCFCIGTNQVDLEAAQEQGVVVFNAPFSNTRSVAELVIAESIMLLRRIPEKNAACHRGDWLKSAAGSYEARGKVLGIIGYGSIGSQVSVLAESLGMKVRFFDVVTKLPLGNAQQVSDMHDLLAMADVVSLHVPESPATKNMMGISEINAMKPGSVLINASRGTVIDIEALTKALHGRHLSGAAVDVFPLEPKSSGEEFNSPLREFDNTILTPHVGGSTQEAQENIGLEVAKKLVKYSDNGTTIGSVNFPEVALPEHPGNHRLLHVHQNIPGVLFSINKIFSENNINICGQYLQTDEKLGYVVIEVDADYSDIALQQLKSVKGTIRCRVVY